MCGLVGLAGDCTLNMKDIFTELLFVDTLRGSHSTGAALVSRYNDDISLEKMPIPGSSFVATEAYKKLIEHLGVKAMIGHNRYATIGEKTVSNAHPFKFPGLVGAHNGTIDRYSLRQLDDFQSFGTDSEAIYNSIHKYGLKDTLGQITGAWALTYYQSSDNSINLIRNTKRPLFYTYSQDRCTLFWSSEAEMLEWILKRHNVKIFEDKIFELETNKHYRWEIPNKVNEKFAKPQLEDCLGWVFQDAGKKYENYHTGQKYFDYGANKNKSDALVVYKAKKKLDTKKFRPPYKDYYGHVINKVQFQKLCETGCVFCDEKNSNWGDFIFPLKDDMDGRKLYMCEDCYNQDDIRELIEAAL